MERSELLAAVEFGFRQCEKGHNLQACMSNAIEMLYPTKADDVWQDLGTELRRMGEEEPGW